MTGRFVAVNQRLTRRIEARWPYARESFSEVYVRAVLDAITPGAVVTDVGAGHRTVFAGRAVVPFTLIGVDVLPDDLERNPALDVRVARDVVAAGLPPESEGSDVVCSHFVLEHMPDVERLAREMHRVLEPGGTTVHVFAGRRSVFAVLNRLLPEAASRRILFRLRPEAVDVGGFETYYDRTWPTAAEAAFRAAGFDDVRTEVSWETSPYFRWSAPAFVAARLWEGALRRGRLRDMASYVVLVARKP